MPLLVDVEIINSEAGKQKLVERANYVWNLSLFSGSALKDINLTCPLCQQWLGVCQACPSRSLTLADKWDIMTHMALVWC